MPMQIKVGKYVEQIDLRTFKEMAFTQQKKQTLIISIIMIITTGTAKKINIERYFSFQLRSFAISSTKKRFPLFIRLVCLMVNSFFSIVSIGRE